MSFISFTIILLLTGFPAYFFARKRRHILLIILVALSLIFIGSFAGLALAAYFIDGVENHQRILRAFTNGFWLSVFGVISGIFWGKKTRYKATPEQ